MNPSDIEELALTLNDRAENYKIGRLQDIRAEIHGKQKVRSGIFDQQTIINDYAYHWGGRTEPQFNVAYRQYDGEPKIRYGLGISLQDSQWSNKSIDEWAGDLMEAMRPRIHLFNEYLTANPEEFSGLKLWYEPEDSTIPECEYSASPIPERFVAWQNFIFLGKREKPSSLSYDDVLTLFDRLLPLYSFIEGTLNSDDFSQQKSDYRSNTRQEGRIAFGVEQGGEDVLHEHPEEETTPEIHEEGTSATVEVNRYERSEAARKACLEHYGAQCQVCGLRFEERYGEIGEGFIEVHHEVPLSENKGVREVDPIDDLKPVCPNCHAMLHQESPPLRIEELRERLRI